MQAEVDAISGARRGPCPALHSPVSLSLRPVCAGRPLHAALTQYRTPADATHSPPPAPSPRPAPYTAADGAEANATLASVCFKPFGGACATQSLLQYWRMDRGYYEAEMAKGPYSAGRLTPDYCFGHWWALRPALAGGRLAVPRALHVLHKGHVLMDGSGRGCSWRTLAHAPPHRPGSRSAAPRLRRRWTPTWCWGASPRARLSGAALAQRAAVPRRAMLLLRPRAQAAPPRLPCRYRRRQGAVNTRAHIQTAHPLASSPTPQELHRRRDLLRGHLPY